MAKIEIGIESIQSISMAPNEVLIVHIPNGTMEMVKMVHEKLCKLLETQKILVYGTPETFPMFKIKLEEKVADQLLDDIIQNNS